MQQDVAQGRTSPQSRSLDIEAFTVTPMLPACGDIGKVLFTPITLCCQLYATVSGPTSFADSHDTIQTNKMHIQRPVRKLVDEKQGQVHNSEEKTYIFCLLTCAWPLGTFSKPNTIQKGSCYTGGMYQRCGRSVCIPQHPKDAGKCQPAEDAFDNGNNERSSTFQVGISHTHSTTWRSVSKSCRARTFSLSKIWAKSIRLQHIGIQT